jgi:multidrug efflux pump subunit AcrA (membrane-fusion protein)
MNCFKINVSAVFLLVTIAVIGAGLVAWKHAVTLEASAAAANQPEPRESVTVAVAKPFEDRQETTAIGTVLALRSITLRNELAGTVSKVLFSPGQIVEAGAVLVRLDVSVEAAELKAQEAQAALARKTLERVQQAYRNRAISEVEVDRAAAERDIARATIARIQATIALAEAQQRELLIRYEQTILHAFRELEDALMAHRKAREALAEHRKAVKASRARGFTPPNTATKAA